MTTASVPGTPSDHPSVAWGRVCRGLLLGLVLAAGAFVMALARSSPGYGWLGCVALVPLYLAMARCSPTGAAICGALWGGSLHFFTTCVFDATIPGEFRALAPMSAIPAVYAWAGARLTRSIGFSPLVLGVGWMGVELGLRPLGLNLGLLAGTQSDCIWLEWVGRALGYVLVAFVVAYINALVLELLRRAVAAIPCSRPYAARGHRYETVRPQPFVFLPRFDSSPLQPRAPPV